MKKCIKELSIILLALIVLGEGAGIYKLYQHNNSQDHSIVQIKQDLESVKFAVSAQGEIAWKDDDFNYLALGNSITKHEICDYWWDDIGMAASQEDKDYFHLVSERLDNLTGGVNSYAYNFSVWENQINDRSQTLALLDNILDERIDLITVQLGENVYEYETFENDYCELLQYIKNKCPDTQIIMIGCFWNMPECENIKVRASQKFDLNYVDLTDIWDDPDYSAAMGTDVYDEFGKAHGLIIKGSQNIQEIGVWIILLTGL